MFTHSLAGRLNLCRLARFDVIDGLLSLRVQVLRFARSVSVCEGIHPCMRRQANMIFLYFNRVNNIVFIEEFNRSSFTELIIFYTIFSLVHGIKI